MRDREFFIPEVLIAARAAKAATDILRPLLQGEESIKSAGTVVIGAVKGDLHDIGENIVGLMLESAGFRIVDLGVDVSAEKITEAVKQHKTNRGALEIVRRRAAGRRFPRRIPLFGQTHTP